jgi:hypothetical protein
MATIQFSFVYQDTEFVNAIGEYLRKEGHNLFIPTEDLLPGKVLLDEISFRLKSADFFIAIFSNHSKNKKFVNAETSQAIGYYKERSKPVIIPIVLDDEPIPEFLKDRIVMRASRDDIEITAERISSVISSHIGQIQAIEEEKKETIARVTSKADSYITTSISRLEKKERIYRGIAYLCYSLCCVSLITAIVYLLLKSNLLLNSKLEITTSKQIQLGLLGFVILALMISISRFLFLIGKSFMVESLRNSDRIHAISFGEFYLKAFGDKADWNEIKEAFQHWNIDQGSTFITQSASEFDPEIFKNIIEFTKLITKK